MIFAVVLTPLLIPIVALGQPALAGGLWRAGRGLAGGRRGSASLAIGLMTCHRAAPHPHRRPAPGGPDRRGLLPVTQPQNIIGGQRRAASGRACSARSCPERRPARGRRLARARRDGRARAALAPAGGRRATVFLGAILLVGRRFAADAAAAKGAELGAAAARRRRRRGSPRTPSPPLLARSCGCCARPGPAVPGPAAGALHPPWSSVVRTPGRRRRPRRRAAALGLVSWPGRSPASLAWITCRPRRRPSC